MKLIDCTELKSDFIEDVVKNIQDLDKIVIPCFSIGEIDGEEFAIFENNNIELYYAAKDLGIEIEFEIREAPFQERGKEFLSKEFRYRDSLDWYDIESSDPLRNRYDFVWVD